MENTRNNMRAWQMDFLKRQHGEKDRIKYHGKWWHIVGSPKYVGGKWQYEISIKDGKDKDGKDKWKKKTVQQNEVGSGQGRRWHYQDIRGGSPSPPP